MNVVLLVFNRPGHTRRMLDAVRAARPGHVFVVADGPRAQVADDFTRCAEVRSVIEQGIDWGAEVHRDYAERNLGLRQRVSSGLSWAFSQAEDAIVIEDDCVPNPSFFHFCQELLERYRHEERVGVVTGDNFQTQPFDPGASYYFSKYAHCWGWATWRRAWQHFDNSLSRWPGFRDAGWLKELFPDPAHEAYWCDIFDRVHAGTLNSWAFPWQFVCWARSQLTATPRVNLVKNIGFGDEATHTKRGETVNDEPVALEFPLTHPAEIAVHVAADLHAQRRCFSSRPRKQPPKAGLAGWVQRLRKWWSAPA